MRTQEIVTPESVRNFIRYPQIIHTAFRAAVYSIAGGPARAFDLSASISLSADSPFESPLVLIFSSNTCIVKGNRNSTSHA